MNFRIKRAEQELSEVDIRLVALDSFEATDEFKQLWPAEQEVLKIKSYTLRRYRQLVQ